MGLFFARTPLDPRRQIRAAQPSQSNQGKALAADSRRQRVATLSSAEGSGLTISTLAPHRLAKTARPAAGWTSPEVPTTIMSSQASAAACA